MAAIDWVRGIGTARLDPARMRGLARRASWVVLVMAIAYVAASVVSAALLDRFMVPAMASITRGMRAHVEAKASSSSSGPSGNYRDIEKSIKDRNLFNSAGDFPDESALEGRKDDKKAGAFDINAPCAKPSTPMELLGTIYLDAGGSVATVMEQGLQEADVYKEGDALLGNDAAQIAKIERNRVIINNGGIKECLELASAKLPPNGTPGSGSGTGASTGSANPAEATAGANSECMLDEKYVQDELGPGFGTIIQKARLVPNTTDNQMNGFKIFAIDQASLLAKVSLQNGDIITQVNETSLKQPEQGFALYQAFQDEKEVRIHILRRGTTPMMITCRIK